ncbi:MAG TPA: hypothetical protein PKE40_11715 [Arachnia sp.]|nr:hypothetical protein [Arachnia sp.]HMT87012.1 hypothetical protein [Arachnia sp.]
MSSTRRPFRRIAVGVLALAAALAGTIIGTATADPVNVALSSAPDGHAPEVAASLVNSYASPVSVVNNGLIGNNQNWNSWPEASGTTLTFTWPYYVEVDSMTFHFWTDCPVSTECSGAVKIPNGITVSAFDKQADAYVPVTLTSTPGPMPVGQAGKRDYPVSREFETVRTSSIKFTFSQTAPVGATEVQIFGVHTNDSTLEPEPVDPGDPAAFLDHERVELRTTPGQLPDLPESIWAIYEPTEKRAAEGLPPLVNDIPVTWDDATIPAADYDAAGDSFTVPGTLTGSEVAVEATVTVYAAPLSDDLEDIDFVSTLTTPGLAPVFPATVTGTFADGSRESGLDATWSDPAPAEYAEAETFGLADATVGGRSFEGYGTFFVVAPSPSDAPPVLLIEFAAGTQAPSGWHTKAPTFTLKADRGVSTEPIESLQYCLSDCAAGGGGWTDYQFPVLIEQQGTHTVKARATDAAGRTGHQETTVRIDTAPPVTTQTNQVNGRNAVITLNATDTVAGVQGSGVSRTVWSSGPSSNPNSSENVMWGTYNPDEKIQLQLSTSRVMYVHFRSEDAAGNVEQVRTVTFQPVQEAAVDVVLANRCVAGKSVLAVTVTNQESTEATMSITTAYGSKNVTLAGQRSGSHAFSTRLATTTPSTVRVSGTAGGLTFDKEVTAAAHSCG